MAQQHDASRDPARMLATLKESRLSSHGLADLVFCHVFQVVTPAGSSCRTAEVNTYRCQSKKLDYRTAAQSPVADYEWLCRDRKTVPATFAYYRPPLLTPNGGVFEELVLMLGGTAQMVP
ncbi:MAG: hypothetical protein ACPGLY_14630 [Rubripirellula sp.]